jgi:hypothetical protein
MYTQDWYMRQIEMMVRVIIKVILKRESEIYDAAADWRRTEYDMIYARLEKLLADGFINEAENLLFDNLRQGDDDLLHIAVDFYAKLNRYDDEVLEELRFSRSEIGDGLQDAMKAYGADIFPDA